MNKGHFCNNFRGWGIFAIILKKGGIFAICPFSNILKNGNYDSRLFPIFDS